MNAASDESGPPPQLVVTGMEQQFDEANGYLEKHKIPWVLEQITQSLVYERPSNPNEFIIRKLEAIRAARARGQAFTNFTKENIAAVFKILDLAGTGTISLAQYQEGMKTLGINSASMKPAGFENNKIRLEAFVDEATHAARKI